VDRKSLIHAKRLPLEASIPWLQHRLRTSSRFLSLRLLPSVNSWSPQLWLLVHPPCPWTWSRDSMPSDAPSPLVSSMFGCCWLPSTSLLGSSNNRSWSRTSSLSTILMYAPARRTSGKCKNWWRLLDSNLRCTPRVQKREEWPPRKTLISEDLIDTHNFIDYRTNPYMSKWRRRKLGQLYLHALHLLCSN